MCGRFTLTSPASKLVEFFSLLEPPAELTPRYNIAPTQFSLCIRGTDDGRDANWLRWGLIPSWAKHESEGVRLINARSETVATKPAFRNAFQSRRCLVPADGFFEWKKTGSHKQPYLIRLRSQEPMAFAGLWERWKSLETNDWLESFTVLTTSPNKLVADIHDRMPVILPQESQQPWLDQATPSEAAMQLLVPYAEEHMEAFPVHRSVGNVKNDSADCIKPVETIVQKELFG
jgi:putative SOS response-associated peptidase YedK